MVPRSLGISPDGISLSVSSDEEAGFLGPSTSSSASVQVVYDKDTFSVDDPMGNADFDLRPFLEAVRMRSAGAADEAVAKKVGPGRSNCLAEESSIYVAAGGELVQDVVLRLRDVESGEVELRLQWVELPNRWVF